MGWEAVIPCCYHLILIPRGALGRKIWWTTLQRSQQLSKLTAAFLLPEREKRLATNLSMCWTLKRRQWALLGGFGWFNIGSIKLHKLWDKRLWEVCQICERKKQTNPGTDRRFKTKYQPFSQVSLQFTMALQGAVCGIEKASFCLLPWRENAASSDGCTTSPVIEAGGMRVLRV